MNEKYKELLTQYDLVISSTFRSRGTFQCETDKGLCLLKEYHGSLSRLALEYEWKEKLSEAGFSHTDQYLLTKENSLIVYDRYHTPHVLKHYFSGKECDCHNSNDIFLACQNLALLHKISSSLPDILEEYPSCEPLDHLFMRRNRELRFIQHFISKKNRKTSFERQYLGCFSLFYEKCHLPLEKMKKWEHVCPESDYGLCHGAYHYHNVLILPDNTTATVNFEALRYQPYLMDLYLFLRKTLEKNHYDPHFFETGISGYTTYLPLSKNAHFYLYLLFLYPEKFWKISNYYFNHRKSWISPKNEEKLLKLAAQNEEREHFLNYLEDCFCS